MALFAASAWYLYGQYTRQTLPPPAPPAPAVAPVRAEVLSESDLARFRRSARDTNADVRWASLELLYALGDPQSIPLLEKAVTDEPDPANRLRALKLLQKSAGKASVQGLVKGLRDPEKAVRLETLKALEKLGDPAAAHWVAEAAADDYEPEVKVEALRILGTFQDERRRQFEELAVRLRQQYEAAVERARRQEAGEPEPQPRKGPDAPDAEGPR